MSNPLDAIEIPVPCQVPWEGMKGDERMRFCGLCKLNVYNLTEMSRKEAEALVSVSGSKICVRLYRRPDGKVLTRSCRAVLALRRTARAAAALVATVVMGFMAWASTQAAMGLNRGENLEEIKQRQPFRMLSSWIEGPAPGIPVTGISCILPPAPQPPAKGGS